MRPIVRSLLLFVAAVACIGAGEAQAGAARAEGKTHGKASGAQAGKASPDNAPDMATYRKPLLVIRFNQRRVYFDRALRQAVEGAERAKPGVMYEIVSYVPSGRTAQSNQRINAQAQGNLADIVNQMRRLGVPDSRMRATVEAFPTAASQEVHIYAH